MNVPTVAEIVTFRLKPGSDPAAFAQAAEAMTPFLRSTGAMISRVLSADAEGLWTETITWTSMQAAKDAAAKMFQQPQAAPFMAMIDQTDMVMRHAQIAVYVPPPDHAAH